MAEARLQGVFFMENAVPYAAKVAMLRDKTPDCNLKCAIPAKNEARTWVTGLPAFLAEKSERLFRSILIFYSKAPLAQFFFVAE